MKIRRLIILFDGTWNRRESTTNVFRLRNLIDCSDRCADHQIVFYQEGVGTAKFENLRGGTFGMGLSDTILEAYLWLIENYFDGDEIFVFGFSRGAFAARGFVGMLTNVGLARPESFGSIVDAYRISRLRAIQPAEAPAVRFRLEHSKDVKVHFLGVWETVGALGLSNWEVRLYESSVNYQLTLFKNIERFYQALAIDEHRFKFKPELLVRARGNDKSEVEQRWFAGAHSNVGGGYEDDPLSTRPLEWLASKACDAGLKLRAVLNVPERSYYTLPKDSYGEMLYGLYPVVSLVSDPGARPIRRWGKRYLRAIGCGEYEVVDYSALAKLLLRQDYRPKNLWEIFAFDSSDERSLRNNIRNLLPEFRLIGLRSRLYDVMLSGDGTGLVVKDQRSKAQQRKRWEIGV